LDLGFVCGARASSLVAPTATVADYTSFPICEHPKSMRPFPVSVRKGDGVDPDRPRWINHISACLCADAQVVLNALTVPVAARATHLLCAELLH
jgi:hypothetical protein